ncbi:MAG: hypothetical protein IPK16_13545 [Anaerolineales bacterium]|nr:hypothetical protein [Anaerolineales bacterium]
MQRIPQHLLALFLTLAGTLFYVAAYVPASAAPVVQTGVPASAGGDPVVLAAGDIAQCNVERDSLTAYLLETHEGTVLTLGDSTNLVGSSAEFRDCFAPTWGQQIDRIYPVPGNHDYGTQGAQGYYSYFGDKATPLEPGCTRDCKGYYSFDLGAWHIVALNSEVASHAGTEQEQWLRADLSAHQ